MRRRPALLLGRVIVVLRPALIRIALLLVTLLLVSLLLIATMLLVASLVSSLLSSVLVLVLTAVIVISLTLSLASALTLVVLVKTILLVLVIPIATTVRLVPIGVVLGLVITPTTLVLLLVFHILEDIGDVESTFVETGRAARHEIKLRQCRWLRHHSRQQHRLMDRGHRQQCVSKTHHFIVPHIPKSVRLVDRRLHDRVQRRIERRRGLGEDSTHSVTHVCVK
mmetsp:Transcript_43919/g.76478  ORF Transcript_43919/g.76478 Transcript_43919/m.76478 type:complete len:224 (-) Transcript_43919:1199-1870(-)